VPHPIRLLATASILAAGCASATFPNSSTVTGEVRIADLSGSDEPPAGGPSLYPTPQRADYFGRLLPLLGAQLIDEDSPGFDEALAAAGLDVGWPRLPFEGYVLVVTAREGRTFVLKAARDELGHRWADHALEQLTVTLAGGRFVRECRVLDWPEFVYRGSKRPQAWEQTYRANFAWGTADGDGHDERVTVVFEAPGSPLDATDAGVAVVMERFRAGHERGVRSFAVKFDDVSFGLTPESELAYGGYARALVRFLSRVRSALAELDPGARLYFLPQTYWWKDPRMKPFAAALRSAGGVERDIGLVMTGPDVISQEIGVEGLAAARRAFGLVHTPALIYDNLGREGDWGPLTGRSPGLRYQADGVFGERGTPVNRLTRLDWAWNPDAYDPEASWERALFELAGPLGFRALREACLGFREGATRAAVAAAVERFADTWTGTWAGPVPHDELVRLLRSDLRRLDRGDAEAVAPAGAGRSP